MFSICKKGTNFPYWRWFLRFFVNRALVSRVSCTKKVSEIRCDTSSDKRQQKLRSQTFFSAETCVSRLSASDLFSSDIFLYLSSCVCCAAFVLSSRPFSSSKSFVLLSDCRCESSCTFTALLLLLLFIFVVPIINLFIINREWQITRTGLYNASKMAVFVVIIYYYYYYYLKLWWKCCSGISSRRNVIQKTEYKSMFVYVESKLIKVCKFYRFVVVSWTVVRRRIVHCLFFFYNAATLKN